VVVARAKEAAVPAGSARDAPLAPAREPTQPAVGFRQL
jgi:hypothetical protein